MNESEFRRRFRSAVGEPPPLSPSVNARTVLALRRPRPSHRALALTAFGLAVVVVIVLVGGHRLLSVRVSPPVPAVTPTTAPTPRPTEVPTSPPSLAPTPAPQPATPSPALGVVSWPEPGRMMVSPSRGPVGTQVTITGTDCSYKGHPAYLVFQGGTTAGTFGAVDIPNVPVDSEGHFRTTFTIPAVMGTLQGRGGGPTRPGQYGFGSKPPFCGIDFTVT
jgi:hypothetical protein